MLPDSQLELVFSSGVTYAAYGNQGAMQLTDGYLVGLLDRPLYIRSDGLLRTLGARLYPWACACLLQGQDTPYIKHAGVIHGLFPALAETIASALRERVEDGVRALDQFLVTRIVEATTGHHLFVTAAQSIIAAGGDLDIETLARASGVSSRTLRRSFGSLLGLSPKQLAQVTRFQYVRDALWENPNASLADLSLAAGYADQAHMQRDFRRFSRQTPRAFATEMRATRALFAPEAVRNLQSL